MKFQKNIFLFVLIFAICFLVGCSQATNLPNNTTANANSNQTKQSETNKNATAGGEASKPSNASTNSEKPAPVYSDLTEKSCKTKDKNESEEWIVQECPGVGGYKLEVFEGDLRSSINVISPNGKKSELEFQKVSMNFSSLGEKAEWHVEKKDGKDIPTALIVRFNASKDSDETKNDSYLIVSKISAEKSCITDVVKPMPNANEEARKLAESASTKPCKTNF